MLSHYWKLGHFIRYYQKKLGWGGKIISQISKAIKMNYPEKKGYSPRNLTYMCQFSRTYPLEVLQKLLSCDMELLKDPYIFDIANAKESADEETLKSSRQSTSQSICWKWETDLPLSPDRSIFK